MTIQPEERPRLGVPVGIFWVSLFAALIIGGLAAYFFAPRIVEVVKEIERPTKPTRVYSSDQYGYSFSYPADLRLERSAQAEGGYVQESIDLFDERGRVKLSVKVIAKRGVQCPFFSLDQFVHCAFLRWQNVNSTPVTVNQKKGIRLVTQGQLPPYDILVASYFEKGDFVFEVDDFLSNSEFDMDYVQLLDSLDLK